jgi:hypothetical protein
MCHSPSPASNFQCYTFYAVHFALWIEDVNTGEQIAEDDLNPSTCILRTTLPNPPMYNPFALVRKAKTIDTDSDVIGHRQFQTKIDIITEKSHSSLVG